MVNKTDLSPAQRFRVRAALAADGMCFEVTRKEALELAHSWEEAERAVVVQKTYMDTLAQARQAHDDILAKSAALLAAAGRLRRRFFVALILVAAWSFLTGLLAGRWIGWFHG